MLNKIFILLFISTSLPLYSYGRLPVLDNTTYRQAKEVVDMYKKINDRRLDPKDIKKLISISENQLFGDLKVLAMDIQRVETETAPEKVFPVCKDSIQKLVNEKNKLVKLFYNSLTDKCLEKFYHAKTLSAPNKIAEMSFELFKIMPKEFRYHFISYFNKLDSSSMDFLEISDNYKTLIKKDSNFYEDDIVMALPPSQDLSNLIQTANNSDKGQQSLFQKELKNILDQVVVYYDHENLSEAAKHFDYAVSFYSENAENLDLKKSWLLFTSVGKSLLVRGEVELSKRIMDFSSTISVEELKNESIFNQYWSYILKGDFKTPIELAKKNKIYDNISSLDQKLIFWIGYCHYKLSEKNSAEKYFSYLLNNYPLSYYTAIVLNFNMFQMNIIRPTRQLASISESRFTTSIERIKYWANIGYDKFVNAEVDSIVDSIQEQDIKSNDRNYKIEKLSELLYNTNKHYLNFRIIHQSLGDKLVLNDKMIRFLFPTENVDILKKNIGPLPITLPISLMRQESAFNRYAVSVAGARGLMQLMPATARRYKRGVHVNELHNPETNIKIGMIYLKELTRRYDGNLINILSAYNAGEGNVAKWSRNVLVYDDPLINIETIPFRETRQYVKLIYRNMFFYSALLGEKPLNGFKVAY